MANQQHLDRLRRGVKAWNLWRKENLDICPDLSGVDFKGKDLSEANLSGADLRWVGLDETNLYQTNLRNANLMGATLNNANCFGANLENAILIGAEIKGATLIKAGFRKADLMRANLTSANLSHARLSWTNLSHAQLEGANLSHARLDGSNLSHAQLEGANFSCSTFAYTIFSDVDLSKVKGLDSVKQIGPSSIGIDTIYRSRGMISETFLQNAGVPNTDLTVIHALVNQSIDYYTCFISYSKQDQAFVERLHTDLQRNGVRCWFASEDMKIGDKIRPRIEESIRMYDKLLLVLSENSIASNWVAYEVERALNKEPEGISNVLFPIRLDDTVMRSKAEWADDIQHTRHIGDFTKWKEHDAYQKALSRLLRDLKAEAPRRL